MKRKIPIFGTNLANFGSRSQRGTRGNYSDSISLKFSYTWRVSLLRVENNFADRVLEHKNA